MSKRGAAGLAIAFAARARFLLPCVMLCLALSGCGAEPAPLVPASYPVAERIDETTIRIRWEGAPAGEKMAIFVGDSPETIDRSKPVSWFANGAAQVRGLEPQTRPYFELASTRQSPSLIVSERLIAFEGTHNFRDLGGYPTTDGRYVRWGQIYRSDHLADLSDADLALFSKLGIRLVCDFRNQEEIDGDPDRLPVANAPRTINPAILVPGAAPSEIEEVITSGNAKGLDFSRLLIDANEMFVRDASAQFRMLFAHLDREDDVPILFHCTAGKDRTGFAAAMILLALGVSQDIVMEDYMLTEIYSAEHIERTLAVIRLVSLLRIDPDEVRPMLGVRPAFLRAALDAIDEDHGSVDEYLRDVLGVSDEKRERLKARLLRKPFHAGGGRATLVFRADS